MNKRKFGFVSMGAVAVVMAFVSVAYACTVIKGQATITNPSNKQAAPNDTITVTAASSTGSTIPNASWDLRFLNERPTNDTMLTCMGALSGQLGDVVIGGPVSSAGGAIGATSGTIPSWAKPGVASVCFVTPGYGTATKDDLLVIT